MSSSDMHSLDQHQSFAADVFKSLPDGIFIINRDYSILQANPALERMFPEQMPVIGKKCFTLLGHDCPCSDCPATIMFHTDKETVGTRLYTRTIELKPGFWIERSASPIFSPSGEVIASICVNKDVSRQKENEHAYRWSSANPQDSNNNDPENNPSKQENLRIHSFIVEGSVPILFADLEGSIQYVNKAFKN